MALLTEVVSQVGNLVISETGGAEYTRDSRRITNGGGAAVTYPVGQPFVGTAPATAANLATANGVLLRAVKLDPAEAMDLPFLVRGPAVVNLDALPTVDMAAAAFNMTTFRTMLEGLRIVVREEPPIIATQAT
jgi:hypothetical protein